MSNWWSSWFWSPLIVWGSTGLVSLLVWRVSRIETVRIVALGTAGGLALMLGIWTLACLASLVTA